MTGAVVDDASPVYDDAVTDVYDVFYAGRGKDFAAEAGWVTAIVDARRPGATSLLDVACGTGEHLAHLARRFPDVAGLELSPAMCRVARGKLGGAPVHELDMRDFDLGRRFDVVCCLTASVAYMPDVPALTDAVTAMARHLVPGGVLVIDPWWSPDTFLDGHVAHDVVRAGDRTVVRVSHSGRDGRTSRHEAHYLAADPAGVRHFSHVQELTLFTAEEYLGALRAAGCDAAHLADSGGLPRRGLFVGVRT